MNEERNGFPKSKESEEYFELLRFPTIGADPMHLRDCVNCAMWLKARLEAIGAEVELVSKGAPPIVLGELKGDEGAPVFLVYGHYDVQPPDPLDEWLTPPFEPTEKDDGRVYCRGAQDDKGQFFAFFCGIRDFLATHNGPKPTIRFAYEGQEESGSTALQTMADELRERLRADVLLVCDTSAAADLRPAIVAGLRGVDHFTVILDAAKCDLHSGRYGAIAPNAAQGMAELIASLHNPDGSIAVRGFMDGYVSPSAEELKLAEESAISSEAYAAEIGCEPTGGEAGRYSIAERNSFRPTIEVNGIHTGYGGPGSKTVIPCTAIAKLSMRLGSGQNPVECVKAVEAHLKAHCPKGMKVRIDDISGLAPAVRLPVNAPIFRIAADALKELDSRGAVIMWDGASIPVVAELQRVSGAAPLLVGFGQGADHIHSPNESYSYEQFVFGRKWGAKIFAALCG